MANSDLRNDLLSALALLTRLPLPPHQPTAAASAWAWPLAGLAVALIASLPLTLHLPPTITAALILGLQAMLTGGLHEDGLADCADGFWGGHSRERRLEIMKDSRIGSYGVLALLIVTLLRWTALTSVIAMGGAFWALIAVAALSRAPMALLMALMPNARPGGLSRAVGRPAVSTALAGLALASILALPAFGFWLIPALIITVAVTLALAFTAQTKIGGQTGDVLGASQQLAEAALLIFLAA
ncbi:adenosylcobinamide-GDP ribazoletransferase [Neogemmobacter tilapiae]|uniref:Adenosylcobinamide-GDP ribazoletransferase n=1 Tax=Neogemmobacter tilapiae TaxID=875041 RepID=A0A918WQ20_9RHOB|nr:adenosylcobinamide-GDP ribazoletransferase [Gemmobacter tilapiae]GHC66932.1 adenosylcobinamide-GDP ribazoletransferase [Gemmobacter tilapiae]